MDLLKAIEFLETYFFDIVPTQNDHLNHVWYVLGSIYVFFTLVGYWVWGEKGGGVSQGIGTQLAHAVFHLGQLKNGSFRNLLFWIS